MTVATRTAPGTHNPRISAQTLRNCLREVGARPLRPNVDPNLTLARYLRQIKEPAATLIS